MTDRHATCVRAPRPSRVLSAAAAAALAAAGLAGAVTGTANAAPVSLQNATTTFTQAGFSGSQTIDGSFSTADAGGVGWAIHDGQADPTSPQTIVWETASDFGSAGASQDLQFSLFAGGFGSHTIGKYRLSYTTDDRSTFADGVDGSGQVNASWTVLEPRAAVSTGGAAYRFQPDGSILMAKQNPNLSTDRIIASTGPLAAPITGFRLEALADVSFPTNGPGRSANGNIVLREVVVDDAPPAVAPAQVILQSATARRSQPGFSVDNAVDLLKPTASEGGTGWANNAADEGNVATFETQQDVVGGPGTQLTFEMFAGGFATHTLGKFRISATTADRSLFADGNDNGGAGVGEEGIWTVLDPTSVTSDNPGTSFTEDGDNIVLSSGAAELETYTITANTDLTGITGFRLEAFTDPSLPSDGPGHGSNGNFVVREFSAFAVVPEPSALALFGAAALGVLGRRRGVQ